MTFILAARRTKGGAPGEKYWLRLRQRQMTKMRGESAYGKFQIGQRRACTVSWWTASSLAARCTPMVHLAITALMPRVMPGRPVLLSQEPEENHSTALTL